MKLKHVFVYLLWPPNKLKGEYKLNHMKMIRRGKAFIEEEDPPLAKLMQSTQQAAIQLTVNGKKE